MLDLVFVTMFAVLPVLGWSIYQVKYRRRFQLHKRLQISLAVVLLLAVVAFEIDMRITGWTDRAQVSPFWKPGRVNDWIDFSLIVHLCCAVPAALLWAFVIVQALRKFDRDLHPNAYSCRHIFWARLAALELVLTSLTGWLFYWLAFVA